MVDVSESREEGNARPANRITNGRDSARRKPVRRFGRTRVIIPVVPRVLLAPEIVLSSPPSAS